MTLGNQSLVSDKWCIQIDLRKPYFVLYYLNVGFDKTCKICQSFVLFKDSCFSPPLFMLLKTKRTRRFYKSIQLKNKIVMSSLYHLHVFIFVKLACLTIWELKIIYRPSDLQINLEAKPQKDEFGLGRKELYI